MPTTTTKEKIVEAGLETIKSEGFAGTSARAIARNGGFNQALIFYHFGTLNDLLLAALDRTSEERMLRYREVLAEAETIPEFVQAAMKTYKEDLDAGHITVLSEMIAGSLSRPDLGPEIVARMEPWVDFAESAISKATDGTPFASILPPRTVAFAIVALYLGVDLLAHLDHDHSRAEDMFRAAAGIAELLAPMLASAK